MDIQFGWLSAFMDCNIIWLVAGAMPFDLGRSDSGHDVFPGEPAQQPKLI